MKHSFRGIASDLHAVLLPHLLADFRCAPSIRWVLANPVVPIPPWWTIALKSLFYFA